MQMSWKRNESRKQIQQEQGNEKEKQAIRKKLPKTKNKRNLITVCTIMVFETYANCENGEKNKVHCNYYKIGFF